ncbi:ribonuclease H-like domain-containing protein [Tanacetum coccineum]
MFLIEDLGKLKYFLGIEFVDTDKGVCLSQIKYCLDLLSDFRLLVCKPSSIPLEHNLFLSNESTFNDPVIDNITKYQNLIGKLIYLTHTRPDIAYFVHRLSRFMHKPLKSHLKIALIVLSYHLMRERAKYGATKKGVQKVKSKITFTTKSDSSMSTRVSSDVNGGSFKEMRDNKIRETLEIKGIDVDYFHGPSAGASSGTLLVWKNNSFAKTDTITGSHFSGKEALWYDLLSIMSSRDGIWLLMGDFNVVRSKEERAGSKLMRRKL